MISATPIQVGGDAIGRAFAYAISRRDFGELTDLLHEDVAFVALTPRRQWSPASREAAVDVLRTWFGDCRVDRVEQVESSVIGDRRHVAYRFTGVRPDGPFVIEQHAYYTERNGQIDWMRVLCSGFRRPR